MLMQCPPQLLQNPQCILLIPGSDRLLAQFSDLVLQQHLGPQQRTPTKMTVADRGLPSIRINHSK